MNLFNLTLFSFLLNAVIIGEIFDHLKPITDKPHDFWHPHQMHNIDFIYMINLDKRPEKLARSLAQLAPYGIVPYRFSAIEGKALSLETLNDIGVKFDATMKQGLLGRNYQISEDGLLIYKQEIMQTGKVYFEQNLCLGAIGCVLSHLSILQDAYNSNYQTIWVMEDDIDVLKDPRIISTLIDRLDAYVGDWDILFTDIDFRNSLGQHVPCLAYGLRPNYNPIFPEMDFLKEGVSNDFDRIKARYGTHSMIVRRSGIEKLLNFVYAYSIFLPIDLDYILPEDIKLYSLKYDLVSQLTDALSNIEH